MIWKATTKTRSTTHWTIGKSARMYVPFVYTISHFPRHCVSQGTAFRKRRPLGRRLCYLATVAL